MKAMTFVDGHVHVHHCFSSTSFLDSAERNIERAWRLAKCSGPGVNGCLLLTESSGANWFARIRRRHQLGRWTVRLTNESRSIVLERDDGRTLIIIAGRQVVTRERLEVLGIGIDRLVTDGNDASQVIERILSLDGVPIIPWGFGKWIGRRGRTVRHLMHTYRNSIALGDNGGRARYVPQPRHFAAARQLGIAVIPGSDPLPFAFEQSRAGSYGCILDMGVSHDHPGRDIVAALRSLRESPQACGVRVSLTHFARAQAAMQFKQRGRAW